MNWSILADDHATGSDHKVIEWEVEADGLEEVDHQSVVGPSLAAIMEKDLEIEEKLWMDLAKERAHLGAESTEDEVEQKAACCQKAMSCILNATSKKIMICGKSKRWWNAYIKESRKAVGREKRRRNLQRAARGKAKL